MLIRIHGIRTLFLVSFSRLGFSWSGNLFLIAPFPDRCLLVHLYIIYNGLYGQQLSLERVKVHVSNDREMENQKKSHS